MTAARSIDDGKGWTATAGALRSALAGYDPRKRECLRRLKEYFMSTGNSSDQAERKRADVEAPPVPFCHRCRDSASSLPHHRLCPHHTDFYNSGSYEILNLVVDGCILGCGACVHQFDQGRPSKDLPHGRGCKRTKRRGGDGGGGTKKRKACGKHDSEPSATEATRTKTNGTRTRPGACKPLSGLLSTPRARPASTDGNFQGPFEAGTLVFVVDRTWPGINDSGGVARIAGVRDDSAAAAAGRGIDGLDDNGQRSSRVYDVRYVIDRRKDRGVAKRFVTLHSHYLSPLKRQGGAGHDKQYRRLRDDGGRREDTADKAGGAADEEQKYDEDGHPLSDYERLRRRNIKRNEARLIELGLLDAKQGGADGDGASSSSRQRGGGARRERRSGREVERRVQPKRRKEKRPEDGAEGAGHRPRDLGCPRRMREDRGDGGGDGGGKTVQQGQQVDRSAPCRPRNHPRAPGGSWPHVLATGPGGLAR